MEGLSSRITSHSCARQCIEGISNSTSSLHVRTLRHTPAQAIDSNRHAVLMTLVDGVPLVQKKRLDNPAQVRPCWFQMREFVGVHCRHCRQHCNVM
jgi:hypothetical protein